MKKEKQKNSRTAWIVKITILAFIISYVFSFASQTILDDVDMITGIIVLLIFILIGVVFDMIGVAVTSADIGPFNAMNAKKIKGANIAVKFIKNADKVSSFCNDVVGDICGIISGSAASIVAISLTSYFKLPILYVTLTITAITASLTIGGKAMGKGFAIKNNTSILYAFAKMVSLIYKPKK